MRQRQEIRPEGLIDIIEEQQKLHVRESYGESAHQCFTDADLHCFTAANMPVQIAENLKQVVRFQGVILAIKGMDPSKRNKLLAACLKPLRPTWAELRRISPEGQTEAGQQAEMMIARAIVNLVQSETALP